MWTMGRGSSCLAIRGAVCGAIAVGAMVASVASCTDDAACAEVAACAAPTPAPPDSGAPEDTGTAEHAGDAVYEPLEGSVSFLRISNDFGRVRASFQVPNPPSCVTITEAGACKLKRCTSSPPTLRSAGTLRVTGGKLLEPIELSPDGESRYEERRHFGPPPLFEDGDVLGVSATGDAFPPFEAQTVAAPNAFQLTSPVPSGGRIEIPRTTDLVFRWNGGSTDVDVTVFVGGTSLEQIDCAFDAANGSGTIDKSLLTGLTRRDHRLEVTHVARARVSVGPSTLEVSAGYHVAHNLQLVD